MKSLLLRPAALFAFVAMLCALPVSAQKKYTIEPSKTMVGVWEPDTILNPNRTVDIKIHIYNTTEAEFSLNWSLGDNNFPAEWKPTACDNANCFDYKDLVGKVKTMAVGAKSGPVFMQGEFKISVSPEDYPTGVVTYGTGSTKITIYDAAKPQETDELTFTAKVLDAQSVDYENTAAVEINPNPAGDLLTVKSSVASGTLSIVSTLGVVQFAAPLENGAMVVNLGGIPSGVYFLKITDVSGESSVRKFIKH